MRFTKILPLFLLLALTGCPDKQLVIQAPPAIIVEPPAQFYDCPTPPDLHPGAYTKKETAGLLNDYDGRLTTCNQSMGSIKSFVEQQKEIFAKDPTAK
jgi:hypothetical protein